MYGWRARIGIIVSPPNTVAEIELRKMSPEGVSVHVTRMYRPPAVTGLDLQVLESTNDSLPQVAAAIRPLKPDLLVFTHTLGSMVQGPGRDGELAKMLGEAAGCHAITTAGATMTAFQAMGLHNIAVVAPYPPDLVELEKVYLEESLPGLKVVQKTCLNVLDGWAIGSLEPRDAYQAARRTDCPEADGIFISGTNWRTIEVIETLEQDLGKPVLSSNQVSMWAALRELQICDGAGPGSLFRIPGT